MDVRVDKDICIGCGLCASMVPEVFTIRDNKAEVQEASVPPEQEDAVTEAIEACPVNAILTD